MKVNLSLSTFAILLTWSTLNLLNLHVYIVDYNILCQWSVKNMNIYNILPEMASLIPWYSWNVKKIVGRLYWCITTSSLSEDFGDRSYNKCSTPTAEIGQWNDPVTCFTKTCLDDSPYLLMMICDDKNVNHVGKCVVPVLKWAGQNVRSVTIFL